MNVSRNARILAVLLATLNWIFPVSQAQALNPPTDGHATTEQRPGVHINDIALGAGGQLSGMVLSRHGKPTDAFPVTVTQKGRAVGTLSPDKSGRFQISGIHGGLFQVSAGRNAYMCRGWVAGTAPPIVRDQLLIVPEGIVENGQRPFSDLFFADPVMVGLIVAAAIAIPIAVTKSRRDSPPGS